MISREGIKFRAWARSSQDIFWISGKAGAGKSCLMKFLLEHKVMAKLLREWAGHDRQVTTVGFFFWAAGNELERSQIGLLRSLLRQVLLKHQELIQQLDVLRDHISYPERPWTYGELRQATLDSVAEVARSSHLAFFVDGLDEFQGDVSDLTDTINELNRLPQVKICVSSRPSNMFQTTYGSNNSELYLELHCLTRFDIDSYVGGRLEAHKNFTQLHGTDARWIVNMIQDKAEGVFLWVTLVIERLRRALDDSYTGQEIREVLQEIPRDLDMLFNQIFDSIDLIHRKMAARTFLSMMMKNAGGEFPLQWLSDLEFDKQTEAQSSILTRTHFQELEEKGAKAARRWCKDLIDLKSSTGMWPWNTLDESFPGQRVVVAFPHRAIHDFIAAKEADGTLQHYAGVSFCPSYNAASTLVRRARAFGNIQNCTLENILLIFLRFCDSVNTGSAPLLVEPAKDMFAFLQKKAHWMLDFEHFAKFLAETFLVIDLDDNAVFLAYILYDKSFILFQYMLTATPQCITNNAKYLWLSTMVIQYDEERLFMEEQYCAMGMILELGVDVNEPWSGFKRGPSSLWTQCLLYLHMKELDKKDGPVDGHRNGWKPRLKYLDILLNHGADPDVRLPISALYLSAYTAKDDKWKLEDEGEVNHGVLEVYMRAQQIRATPGTPEEYIPATAAFEYPRHGPQRRDTSERYYKEFFPIVKQKLVAASRAKAAAAQKLREEYLRTSPPTWMEFVRYL